MTPPHKKVCLFFFFFCSVLITFGLVFPLNRFKNEEFLETYKDILKEENSFPVITFNIRLDVLESNPENHFTKRIWRLSKFLNETQPFLIGLQEPFSGQLLHLQSILPAFYKAIGDETQKHIEKGDKKRINDYQTGILFHSEKLELIEHDHFWLSESPRVPNSKSWRSNGIRTVTIGAFKEKSKLNNQTVDIIHFNTHLDVWSSEAREKSAHLLLKTMKEWSQKYPNASIILTGDFNTANGHLPHQILLEDENFLKDSWDFCQNNLFCKKKEFSSSFHGWFGTWIDKYLIRLLHFILQTIHGSGVELPVPFRIVTLDEIFKILKQLNPLKLYKSTPSSLSRIHVDWVIVSKGLNVKMAQIAEIRDQDFSSDHFPVVVILEK